MRLLFVLWRRYSRSFKYFLGNCIKLPTREENRLNDFVADNENKKTFKILEKVVDKAVILRYNNHG